jgi:pyruvate ferredoxin oxidoreductase gamma subunit
MDGITEIRVHGRGGQGAVTTAELIAIAAFKDGKFSQAMPNFGPERRGSPVEAYCRLSGEFIMLRTQVYGPDYVIVLDDSLPGVVDITRGLAKGGMVLINSEEKKKFGAFATHTLDANKIAMEVLGKPIVNTVMLGAFAKATRLVSLGSLLQAVEERFEDGGIKEKNMLAIKKAYEETKA